MRSYRYPGQKEYTEQRQPRAQKIDFKKGASNGVLSGPETKKECRRKSQKAAKLSAILSGVFVKQACRKCIGYAAGNTTYAL
jgi:hypothetical protein